LAIATRAMGERGFDRTSIRAIAKEAGVSNRTVQHHFATKDELWRALVDEVLVPGVQRVGAAPSPGARTIAGSIGARVERALTRPRLSGAMLTDPSEGARERMEYVGAAVGGMLEQHVSAMEALIAAKALRPVDPTSLSIVIAIGLACISSAGPAVEAIYGVDLGEPAQHTKLTDDVTDLLLYGLLPRADEP
jgi:TetR/AcrR family transcriptional regulator